MRGRKPHGGHPFNANNSGREDGQLTDFHREGDNSELVEHCSFEVWFGRNETKSFYRLVLQFYSRDYRSQHISAGSDFDEEGF
ncbi:MAG TPA: hypothetical protein VFE58_19905 [Tepidisphaeraceae bacterium]|nr:hypothetical protein [Tepidisphaeraceae bacterium]